MLLLLRWDNPHRQATPPKPPRLTPLKRLLLLLQSPLNGWAIAHLVSKTAYLSAQNAITAVARVNRFTDKTVHKGGFSMS